MISHLEKITKRAKQIRKAHPKKAWTACVSMAAKELKKAAPAKKVSGVGRTGKAKGRIYKQTGSSTTSADKAKKAKRPGYRVSASGKKYLETRKNRSDRPGSLTGVKATPNKLNKTSISLVKKMYMKRQLAQKGVGVTLDLSEALIKSMFKKVCPAKKVPTEAAIKKLAKAGYSIMSIVSQLK